MTQQLGIFLVTVILVTAVSASSPWSQWSCVAGSWRRSATQFRGLCGGQVMAHQDSYSSPLFNVGYFCVLGRDKLQTRRVQMGRTVLQRRYLHNIRANVWNLKQFPELVKYLCI